MGLLDDAIREHLELKRLHGADPTEVERQEREAFGAAQRAAAEAAAAAAAVPDAADLDVPEADVPTPGPSAPPPEPDMIPEPPVSEVADLPAREPEVIPDVDWTDPRPAQPVAAEAEGDPDADEDVLEETPDFLQETPEHDRLWFEQRPPRDFDF
jgi:hypothetical protein